MNEVEKIDKIIIQAASSIWLDNLPLSKEYVLEYRNKKINKLNNKKMVLKRGVRNGQRGK